VTLRSRGFTKAPSRSTLQIGVPNRVAIFLICVIALLAGPAASAQADTATQLPLTTAAAIVVDPGGKHVFVSGDSSVVALNYAGKIVKTIQGENGAAGMALDAATHTLYVALNGATAISEINTQTLTETHRFSTAPYAGPSSLVIAGGKLWFSCFQTGCLATANLDGTGLAAASGISGFSSAPALLASGGSGNHLLALADRTGEPPRVAVYDVSGATPVLVSSVNQLNGGAGGLMNEMTFDPSGAHLLAAESSPAWIQSLTTSTLLPSAQYPTGPYPIAVAVTGDGKYVAGGVFNPSGKGDDVFVYPVDSTKPVRTWDIGTSATGNDLVGGALAFSPDSSSLFAITHGPNGHLEFNVLLKPTVHLTVTRTSLTRSAKSVRYGHLMTLKAHVKGTRHGKVDLYATTSSNIKKLVAKRTLKKGVAKFKVKPRQNTTYSAQLEQASGYASSTSKDVLIGVTPVVIVGVHRGGKVQYQGHLVSRTWLPGTVRPKRPAPEPLGYVVERAEGGSWLTVVNATFPIESDGTAHVFFLTNRAGSCRVRVSYAGDTTYARARSGWKNFRCT
jgi:hypothetical protein